MPFQNSGLEVIFKKICIFGLKMDVNKLLKKFIEICSKELKLKALFN